MTIAPALRKLSDYPKLNPEQLEVIGHTDGPTLIIAGPGTGKTFVIILRALNILLLGKAKPSEVILCTFTEKAAFEMRDRLTAVAREIKVDDDFDLSELHISTIHSLCNTLLRKHRHRIPLGHNYETLDDLTQILFILEHFDEIIGDDYGVLGVQYQKGRYFSRWDSKRRAIESAKEYFNKITEELIDPEQLILSGDRFLYAIGKAYRAYQTCLFRKNRVDFAHLQSLVYNLLLNEPEVAEKITSSIRYILVDEYQDTNYIQEQLLLKLISRTNNICVVGDEDQSLYRFRGATVRNILEFPEHFSECKILKLTTNYRSHCDIIERYDRWMASADWSNPNGRPFRYGKTIKPDPDRNHAEYQAVISIRRTNYLDEEEQFASLVKFLKDSGVIEDYSQVALLLYSVQKKYSAAYIKALDKYGIPAFCPRAKAYFDNEEIQNIVACFAIIFGWLGGARGEVSGSVEDLADYVDSAIDNLDRRDKDFHLLDKVLQEWSRAIARLRRNETLDMRPADYFYRLLAFEPFKSALKNENAARNLSIFSQLLNIFQRYYNYVVVTYSNRDSIRFHLFNSFLNMLYDGGINEYEDPYQPFPKGHVQIMTIHQAKGLEFPVVVVGSLSMNIPVSKDIDRYLAPFYHRRPFEPEDRITTFDRMRLHYVAFSRAQHLLVLTTSDSPKSHFLPILDGLPQWLCIDKQSLAKQRFESRERTPIKKKYSFTGDLKIYETCPRQYQFYRYYEFTPSRSAVIFFGLLVHQTIEEIHRVALDGKPVTLDEDSIRALFEQIFHFLLLSDVRPIDDKTKEVAFTHVMNYFTQNKDIIQRIVETEVDVSVEKEDYILTGKVDIILGGDGKLELLDFKTAPRPISSPQLLDSYRDQLCTYAHILEQRYNKRVDRLMLYWTSEPRREDALMVLPYDPSQADEAGRRFDELVRRIKACDFTVKNPPEPKICNECDLKLLCRSESIIIS